METLIETRNLRKYYGTTAALDGVSLEIPEGKIVGLVGANGAGKTTLLRCITGLIEYEGEARVMGMDALTQRAEIMKSTGVIHDIPVLPPWMSVEQIIEFQNGIQPGFDTERCHTLLKKTKISQDQKVRQLSKGMKTQLHLAMMLAADSRLLILDEPTHGLDIIFRKELYSSVLEDYFDQQKSILISTHQVEEVEHILSDVIFIRDGRVILSESMDALKERFLHIEVPESSAEEIRSMNPLSEQRVFGKCSFLLENPDREKIENLGEIRAASIADIFMSTMGVNNE